MKKSKQDGVYFFWSTSIILCMLAVVFVLGFASCSKGTPAVSPSPSPSPVNSTEPVPPGGEEPSAPPVSSSPAQGVDARLGETADMGQAYVDKFVFLGDSTTYGLGYYDVVPDEQVWTPASGTLTLDKWSTATIVYPEDGSEISIVDAMAKKQPEYLLITLGVNGISFMKESYFIEVYTALVQAVQEASPDTKIILNSIYPTTARYPESTGITNEKIIAANGWIERIANTLGIRYLDSASVLKDENGYMPDSIDNGGDGLHMNADGYKLVIDYVRTHGYE
jgi:lysophospholipase L1-like esterase